jgi:hypothetical protein
MQIIKKNMTIEELKTIAASMFGDMVKAVVDVERGLVAIDAELQADLEALLLQDGSRQNSLWGINFYPDLEGDDFIEFDSMINIRPSQNNLSRSVDSKKIREKIVDIVRQQVIR